MILILRGRAFWATVLLGCCMMALGLRLWYGAGPVSQPAFSPGQLPPVTAVVDPGHGGEDGGASAADGTLESRLNLEIALGLRDLLTFTGTPVVMTRETEEAVGDLTLPTVRQRKQSDLRRRVEIVEQTPGAVLLSIHQNSLPSAQSVTGPQVFWNRGEGADALAERLQDALNQATGGTKQPRPIGDSVYLTRTVTAPAVIIECGFLSNSGEAARLAQPDYQKQLAAAVAAGFLARDSGAEEEP